MAISTSVKREEEHIRKVLPLLLKEDTQFRREIYVILTETFPTREELKQILDELRLFRKEANEKFEASDRRFEAVVDELRLFRKEANERFEAIDQRFEASDRRFEAVVDELRLFRKEANERFEAIDQRFEAIDQRFEAVDRRFEAVDRRFEAVDRRFEAMDRRFNELIKEIHFGFETLGDRIDRAELSSGRFTKRVGHQLEKAIAGALRIALERRDISAENITLNKKLVDKEGLIGPKDREYEIDLLMTNTEVVIFEVKSYLKKKEEVEHFNDLVALAKKSLKIKKEIRKVIIALEKEDVVVDVADKLGIILG